MHVLQLYVVFHRQGICDDLQSRFVHFAKGEKPWNWSEASFKESDVGESFELE